MNIVEVLSAQVADRPQAVAIIDRRAGARRTTTFAELDRQSRQGAALLWSCGLRRGDGVLVFHRISADLYAVLISLFRLGAVAIVIDPAAGVKAIDRCCAEFPPRAFVGGPRAHLLRVLSPAVRRIPLHFSLGSRLPRAVPWSRAEQMSDTAPIEECPPDTPALLTFTSGSTGLPKAACRTHGLLLAQYQALHEVLGLAPGEIDLTTLPIVVLANLASGVTSLIPDADLRAPGSIAAGSVLDQIEAHGATRATASPAMFERLADHCLASGRTIPGLEKVVTGGGPVFLDLLEKMKRVAPNADPTLVYGSTEAEPIAKVTDSAMSEGDRRAMLRGRGLLAGMPVQSVALRILPDRSGTPVGPFSREAFDAACLSPGQTGEIVVSGAHVVPGYLHGRGDEETKVRVDGAPWHRTGDAGCLDAMGRLWLLGRCEAKVRDVGGVLYPFAVECAARHHPNVRRAALVSRDGGRVLAVQLRDTHAAAADLRALLVSLTWADIDSIRAYRQLAVDTRHNAKIDYGALGRLLDGPPVATAHR